MILGRGTAPTDAAIVAEYQQFVLTSSGVVNAAVCQRLQNAPLVMGQRIGKPLADWTEEDILALFVARGKATWYYYCTFIAFLLFRGYRRASLAFLLALPCHLSRMHRPALQPYRQKLEATQRALSYAGQLPQVGSQLTLLIFLLVRVAKPLDELRRADFDAFREEYQHWYRADKRRGGGVVDADLTRLEYYLVHWGVIPPGKVVFRHEEHFAALRHAPIREAILTYMRWCDAKYQPSTIHTHRAAVLGFFLWLQQTYPTVACLDGVTRPVALVYAGYLKHKGDDGTYSPKYRNDLYRVIRLFFEFAIREGLDSSPSRNPFALGDTPREPDPVPRYLPDRDLQVVLNYCATQASLLERVVVITLLHTGIRACELADLKESDLVQIQGRWKLHIHEGKGLKDRLIPLTEPCQQVLCAWQEQGKEPVSPYLFTTHGRGWSNNRICDLIRELGLKLGLDGLTPHRFRHTFAVALLNYGMRESALQKLMGHKTLGMTLEYARILDQTVERAFTEAVEQMQSGARSWVPSFFASEEYTLFAEGDTVSWIRLPHGYCRRNPKLHCESDVKCLLCERYAATAGDLPRLREMHERFVQLGLSVKAEVVAVQIQRLEAPASRERIPLELVVRPPGTMVQ
jgi:integrase